MARREAAVVATFLYRYEADYAKGFLDEAGVTSAILSDQGGAVELSLAGASVRLAVPIGELRRAQEVLRTAGILEE